MLRGPAGVDKDGWIDACAGGGVRCFAPAWLSRSSDLACRSAAFGSSGWNDSMFGLRAVRPSSSRGLLTERRSCLLGNSRSTGTLLPSWLDPVCLVDQAMMGIEPLIAAFAARANARRSAPIGSMDPGRLSQVDRRRPSVGAADSTFIRNRQPVQTHSVSRPPATSGCYGWRGHFTCMSVKAGMSFKSDAR